MVTRLVSLVDLWC